MKDSKRMEGKRLRVWAEQNRPNQISVSRRVKQKRLARKYEGKTKQNLFVFGAVGWNISVFDSLLLHVEEAPAVAYVHTLISPPK